ncbi:hypothetical protein DB30_00697 [Enhygromyxa salina]|uniref:Uncharacterized protein n=1 Tax=Enhygromyxa salina TaxID=215803 RepID=A0A0C2DFL2_9BACT|nr:hypothetical protein DB30_00697 [Enhygromyxa salina]
MLGQWFMDPLMELCGRLPKLTTVGVSASYGTPIAFLLARPPLRARVRRLEVLWSDDAVCNRPVSELVELVEGSVFDEFRWYSDASRGELVLYRTGPGRFGVVEGDAHVLEDLDVPPVPATFDKIRVYWANDPDPDPDHYDGVRALAERTGAILEIEKVPGTRLLPTPEVESAV